MIAIIAEKPSVAREIAAIVGATSKNDGYLQGNNYLVTWAFGHLIQLAMPEEYGIKGFIRENLPIIPEPFILKPRQTKVAKEYKDDPGALKQLHIIQDVFNKCDKIIVATDAGREGELIFRYIYQYLNCQKSFERLWISSLTEKAIKEGLHNLKDGRDYDKLYQATQARSEADWLVGLNASQALSIAAGQGVFSLGRVQTPTLAMVCSRFLENTNFKAMPYWDLRIDVSHIKSEFSATTKDRILSFNDAENLLIRQKQDRTIVVESIEKKELRQEPPLLYDLTTLQKEANNKHGFSADKTLSIAQKLYEAKLITYPRTGSRYLSSDVFDTVSELLRGLHTHPKFGDYAQSLTKLNTRSVDEKKITDHHAIIITENTAKDLSADDKAIYEMIVGRMLEAFSEPCIKDQTSLLLNSMDILYQAKGSVTKVQGWRAVYMEKEDKNDENKELPVLEQGQELMIEQVQLLEKHTKPKPLHTEASLLGAMEVAGKNLEDEEQRLALKKCGIGTPATRASIIETLFARDYMLREKKSLIPTEKGLAVYEAVKDKRIADVEMTGLWENTFAKIEAGEQKADNFKKGIEIYASQITEELLNAKLSLPKKEVLTCPKCKKAPVNSYPKVLKCSDANCDLVLFPMLCGKTLSNDVMQILLSGKQTSRIKGFKSKAGKSFDAALILDENFKIKFVFSNTKKKR